MESYGMLRDIAIILVAAKYLGLLARKLNAPQVAGEILAGLVVGPCLLGLVQPSAFLTQMAEIGVVLLMFSAGMDSDIKEIIRSGPVALLIAASGVLIPLAAGTGLYMAFYGSAAIGTDRFYQALFIGCILTATSVSITVQALRELGHMKGRVGTTILSAAIIDDVLGILVLTVITGFKDPGTSPGIVLRDTALFFIFSIIAGYLAFQFFDRMNAKYPRKHRLPVLSLAFCMAMSYVAEEYFGIADITGAYVAGLILSNLRDAPFIEQKLDINSYMIFGPLFFASIGLSTDTGNLAGKTLAFSIALTVVALLAKVVGCGLMARLCHFSTSDSLKIGVGMMNRGEVALIVAQKGLAVGLMSANFFPAVILLIIVSAVVTPIALKILYQISPEEHPVPESSAQRV